MLCGFADAVPPLIGWMLQKGAENNRDIGETTCADLMMLAFGACKGAGVTTWHPEIGVRYSEERKTGADLEWWFVCPADDTYLRILVQCKRLYTRVGPGSQHRHRRAVYWAYDMLHHESPAGVLQAETLVNYARQPPDGFLFWPLYAFFNRADVPCPAEARPDGSPCADIEGVNLACGYVLERHLQANRSSKARRVTTLRKWLWSMRDLFCPDAQVRVARASPDDIVLFLLADAATLATTSVGMVPHPRIIAERLARFTDGEIDRRPSVGTGIPNHILNQLKGEADEHRTTTGLKRIVFRHEVPDNFIEGRFIPAHRLQGTDRRRG